MPKFVNLLGTTEKINIKNLKYDFVSLASHQLRTPLSAVKWSCEILLKRGVGKLSKKQQYYLKEIYRSNERAIGLVNDLLDVSRIQQGQIHLDLRPAKVEKIIEDVIETNSNLVKEAGVKIDFEIVNGPLPIAQVDSDKVRRVMTNLLVNAIKYTPKGGKIRIVVEKKTSAISISISDTGIGIPKNEQSRVFDKFFRSNSAIKLAPDGTGLGLFIVKSLVVLMGGKISFHSAEGQGTEFRFTLSLKN